MLRSSLALRTTFSALSGLTLASLTLASSTLFLAPTTARAQSSATTSASTLSRITQPVNEKALVALPHAVHPLANAANDRGLADASLTLDRMQIVLKRSAAQEASLHQLIGDLHAPGSPSYHQWLTPDQFGQQFGPTDADVATLSAWLQGHGFGNVKLNPGRQTLEFSGNVAQFRSAFHADIHKYAVNGQTHYAAASDPMVPAALATVLGGFTSLNNFRPHTASHLLGKATYNAKARKASPNWTTDNAGASFLVAPGDYAVQYDLNPLYTAGTNGTGQTIAIIDASNIDVSLVNNFRTLFGLPVNPPNVIIDGNDPGIEGVNNPDGPFTGSSLESYLDVEWAGAVAPNATIDLVIGADTALQSGFVLAAEHAVYANLAPVLSLSFGECEAALGSGNLFWNNLWSQAAAQGITVMVSTGDSGSAACDSNDSDYAIYGQAVNGFASTPYNVALGGTDFFYSAYHQDSATLNAQLATYWNQTASNGAPIVSLTGVIPEQPFNSSQYGLNIYGYTGGETTTFAAGGGASNAGYPTTINATTTYGPYPKPSWQTGTGVPADNARDVPDLSLFGALGYNDSYVPVCAVDGDCQPVASGEAVQVSGVGGTSVAAPSFAAMMSLVNQRYGRQGQANYVLYPLAAQYPAAFHDITNGNNSVPCNITTISFDANNIAPDDCISVGNPATDTDATYGLATEGQIGNTSTQAPWYTASNGYDLASGLGSVDANVLVSNWSNVHFASSGVTLSPSLTSFTHGTTITVSGTVSGSTPTGTVALMTDSSEPLQAGVSTFPLTSGSYSSGVDFLPGGTYNIYGRYSGDAANAASTSAKTQITVTAENSSLYFNLLNSAFSSTNAAAIAPGASVPYGTQLLLAAQPLPTTFYTACILPAHPPANCSSIGYGTPTGSVSFSDGGAALATATVNAEGEAESNTAFSVGQHSVTARYSGDSSYNASSASAIAFTVTKDTPSIALTSTSLLSANTYQGGQDITFTLQVENQANAANAAYSAAMYSPALAPTGSVTLSGLPAGVPTSGVLSSAVDPSTDFAEGIAAITAPASTPAGTYTVTVTYAGDANYAATSQAFPVTITGANTTLAASTIVATANATSTSPGSSVNVTSTVTGQSGLAAPTGTVLLSTSGHVIGYVALTPGNGDISSAVVALTSSDLITGANLITLQYSGDFIYQPSSTSITITSGTTSGSPNFSLTATPASLTLATPGASGTTTLALTPSYGFTGNLTLACSVTVAPSSATSIPTCSVPATTQIGSSSVVGANLTVNSTSSTSAGSYTITATATSGSLAQSTSIAVTVGSASSTPGTPGFTLGATTPAAINAGGTATATITVSPNNGFLGSVALACSISPSNLAGTPGCSITAPAAISSSSTSVAATLSVSTFAASTATLDRPANPADHLRHPENETAIAALLFGLPIFGVAFRSRRRRSAITLLALAFIAILTGASIGCGSGTNNAPASQATTTAGTVSGSYTVTITGTGTATGSTATVTQSTTVTVTVN